MFGCCILSPRFFTESWSGWLAIPPPLPDPPWLVYVAFLKQQEENTYRHTYTYKSTYVVGVSLPKARAEYLLARVCHADRGLGTIFHPWARGFSHLFSIACGKGCYTGPPLVGAGSLSFLVFRCFWTFSLGSRAASLPPGSLLGSAFLWRCLCR